MSITTSRRPVLAAASVGLLGLAGCWSGSDASCASALEQEADVVTPGEVPRAPESSANLTVDVSSTLVEAVRVTVTIDDALALDVSAPGTPEDCAHQPVHRYGFDLPTGPVVVAVTTDRGEQGSVDVEVGARPQWVVVGVQEGFPLEVDLWRERPEYG